MIPGSMVLVRRGSRAPAGPPNRKSRIQNRKSVVLFAALCLCACRPAGAAVYANITGVDTRELTNGVQITVAADGVLKYRGNSGGTGREIALQFPGARSRVGKSYIDVGTYPVSGILIVTPQNAPEGIGIDMKVTLFESSGYNVTQSTDQQSVIITVDSGRTIERDKRGKAASGASTAPGTDVRFEDGLLTVHAYKASIHALLGLIAEKADVDIAVDDAVARTASLNLDRMPVDAVMRAIASAYGLALAHEGGVYMISKGVPDDLAAYRLSGTESFRMKNIQADTASELLPFFLLQYVHRNSEQNAVVVTAPSQMLKKIGADLRKVDVAPPMILIEAVAVEVNSTRDLDTALGLRIGDQSLEPAVSVDTPNPSTGVQANTATGDVSYRNIGHLPGNFQVSLRALEESGKARIHATPSMAAVNGRTASLFIGSQKFIQVLFNQWGSQQTKIIPVDVGVKLDITPWTGGSGEITTRIEPEVSNIVELDPKSGLPVLSTRRAKTSVRVKDGETIVIGGLRQKQQNELRRKIPFLGDIPLVGNLFRSKTLHVLDTELVIFVTPHILTDTGHLPDAAKEQEVRKRMLGE